MAQETKAAVAVKPQNTEIKGDCTFEVAGKQVHLNYQIVRDFLTRGGGKANDQDIALFIANCKFNQLNPFLNEAFLVKYGDTPATMVVSKEAFFKRADACEDFEGIEAGLIVKKKDQPACDVIGCFHDSDETIVGAWATVHRSDRKYPFISRICFAEYNKSQSLWKDKPATMIVKVAKVQALREAFPAQLGALYVAEESSKVEDASFEEVKNSVKEQVQQAAAAPVEVSFETPQPAQQPAPAKQKPQPQPQPKPQPQDPMELDLDPTPADGPDF